VGCRRSCWLFRRWRGHLSSQRICLGNSTSSYRPKVSRPWYVILGGQRKVSEVLVACTARVYVRIWRNLILSVRPTCASNSHYIPGDFDLPYYACMLLPPPYPLAVTHSAELILSIENNCSCAERPKGDLPTTISTLCVQYEYISHHIHGKTCPHAQVCQVYRMDKICSKLCSRRTHNTIPFRFLHPQDHAVPIFEIK